MASMALILTNEQRDLLGVIGIALAVIQTLLAVYSVAGSLSVRTQDDVERARMVRDDLGKMCLLLICSEAIVVIVSLFCWFDGRDWRAVVAIISLVQTALAVFGGVRIFRRSRNSVSVAMIYAIFLTIAATIAVRYRVHDSEALDIHQFGNVFRFQLLPLAATGMALTGSCFAIYAYRLARHLVTDLEERPVGGD
jgi:hypothetical protein